MSASLTLTVRVLRSISARSKVNVQSGADAIDIEDAKSKVSLKSSLIVSG